MPHPVPEPPACHRTTQPRRFSLPVSTHDLGILAICPNCYFPEYSFARNPMKSTDFHLLQNSSPKTRFFANTTSNHGDEAQSPSVHRAAAGFPRSCAATLSLANATSPHDLVVQGVLVPTLAVQEPVPCSHSRIFSTFAPVPDTPGWRVINPTRSPRPRIPPPVVAKPPMPTCAILSTAPLPG